MNDVRFPIETTRDGNKITKVCVEDIYKVINRVQDGMNRAFNNTVDIIDSVHKDVKAPEGTVDEDGNPVEFFEGELIIGTGISQPCLTDAFDEEIGNNIAFMKMKLNANIKKHNLLCKVYNAWFKQLDVINQELNKIDLSILRDLQGVRMHNESYLEDIEYKLGIY